ncbi:hypothetical protein [Streptomyces misionensis]|uniref:hypothetical protein n=1 Tax=Streptomyces misionensis TaxID=67331 RepID=UPI0036D0D797
MGSCTLCINWAPRGGGYGVCRRCRHEAEVDQDGICRPCTVEIRLLPDLEWTRSAVRSGPGPVRDLQLSLRLPGIQNPNGYVVRKRRQPVELPPAEAWKRRYGRGARGLQDDSRVCPPQVVGQLALLPRLPRAFTREHAQRIADRSFPEMAEVLDAVERIRERRGLSTGWRFSVMEVMMLALASREAGERLVDEYVIAELPRMRPAVASALKEAGLLRRRLGSGLAQSAYQREWRRLTSCEHCLAWAGDAKPLCDCCREWARHPSRTTAPCERCGRTWPLKDGKCRFCHQVLYEHLGDGPAVEQLWFGGYAPGLNNARPGDYGRDKGRRSVLRREKIAQENPRVDSAMLVSPGQVELFSTSASASTHIRQWARLKHMRLPTLTPQASQLVVEFRTFAKEQQWTDMTRAVNLRTLRFLAAWLGVDAPLHESDIREVARFGSSWGGRRVVPFLSERGLLIPLERTDPEQAAVERLLDTLPEHLQDEVKVWVRVLRGEGRRPSPAMDWATIRRYSHYHVPVLQKWGKRIGSLREITPKDIEDAVTAHTGNRAHGVHGALRSLFRALKRERIIFRDPARNVSATHVNHAPRRIPSDRLAGLLDRAPTAMAKAVVALAAIHALGSTEIRRLQLTDLNRSAGRLITHRRGDKHTVYLDELTLKLLTDWLRERAERWPRSTNPHLFVTQVTALDPTGPPVAKYGLQPIFTHLGLQPRRLRVDRILDEAHETADPVHLMRVFGIAPETAMKYVKAAHPQRFGKEPTQA